LAEADSKSQSYSDVARGWIDTAQEAAKGTAQKVNKGSADGSRVDNGEVGAGVIVAGRRSTGQGGWIEDLTAFMRERPLIGAALMIGIGYVAGSSRAVKIATKKGVGIRGGPLGGGVLQWSDERDADSCDGPEIAASCSA
jgi:hypothetical protein